MVWGHVRHGREVALRLFYPADRLFRSAIRTAHASVEGPADVGHTLIVGRAEPRAIESAGGPKMREILQMCIRMDETAEDAYRELSTACPDTSLAETFELLAHEQADRVAWWKELLDAYEQGLVPDIVDEGHLRSHLRELDDEITLALPDSAASLSPDDMLDAAAHLEFYLLDPAFGELLSMTDPGESAMRMADHAKHIDRLVVAIEARHSRYQLAQFLARVLRRSLRDQQRLAELATHDQLTGLLNRRGLYATLRQWSAWASRYGRPVGVALVDLDEFKRVNDTLGHPVGDRLLTTVASVLSAVSRESDVIGRYGGDEFLILAPEGDRDSLNHLLERIVSAIRDAELGVEGTQVKLTASTGGAWTSGSGPISAEQLLAAADRSLYAAKLAGRNRAGAPIEVEPEDSYSAAS